MPLEALNQLDPSRLDWLVPGLLEEKVLALIRALPKSLRTLFVPAPESAKKVLPLIKFGEGDFHAAVAAALGRLAGQHIPPDAFQEDRLPNELRMNVRVTGAEGETLAVGRESRRIAKNARRGSRRHVFRRPTIRSGTATASRRGISTNCRPKSRFPAAS